MTLDNVIAGILILLLATVAASLSVSLVLMIWEDMQLNKRNPDYDDMTPDFTEDLDEII
jgi:hypothetical protein